MLQNNTKPKMKGGLKFQEESYIKIADRDYGLMRVTQEKGHTPYPKAQEPLDINLLRARLSIEQKRIVDSDDPTSKPKITKLKKCPLPVPSSTPMSTLKNIIDGSDTVKMRENEYLKKVSQPGKKHVIIGVKSDEYIYLEKESNTTNVRKSVKTDLIEAQDSYKSILQQRSFVLLNDSPRSSLSFYQQRKEFDKAEFSIAKNGKKMSELFMDASQPKYEITDEKKWVGHDKKASEAIDRYLKKFGLVKRNANNMSGFVRSLSDEGSLNTMK